MFSNQSWENIHSIGFLNFGYHETPSQKLLLGGVCCEARYVKFILIEW